MKHTDASGLADPGFVTEVLGWPFVRCGGLGSHYITLRREGGVDNLLYALYLGGWVEFANVI